MTTQPPISIQQEQETYIRQDGSTFTRADIFVKLSVTFRDGMLQELKGPPLSVFLCIALHCGNEDMEAWPSLKKIVAETGYSNRAVIDAVRTLEKADLIAVRREESDTKGNEVNHYEVKGYATMGGSEPSSLGVVNPVHKGSEPSSHEEESMEEESTQEDQDQESANADDGLPRNFQGWHTYIRDAENRGQTVHRLRQMCGALYPGLDPPEYQYVGRVAKRLHAGRMADLLWQFAPHPPTGDLLAYIQAAAKGNGRSDAPDNATIRAVEQLEAEEYANNSR